MTSQFANRISPTVDLTLAAGAPAGIANAKFLLMEQDVLLPNAFSVGEPDYQLLPANVLIQVPSRLQIWANGPNINQPLENDGIQLAANNGNTAITLGGAAIGTDQIYCFTNDQKAYFNLEEDGIYNQFLVRLNVGLPTEINMAIEQSSDNVYFNVNINSGQTVLHIQDDQGGGAGTGIYYSAYLSSGERILMGSSTVLGSGIELDTGSGALDIVTSELVVTVNTSSLTLEDDVTATKFEVDLATADASLLFEDNLLDHGGLIVSLNAVNSTMSFKDSPFGRKEFRIFLDHGGLGSRLDFQDDSFATHNFTVGIDGDHSVLSLVDDEAAHTTFAAYLKSYNSSLILEDDSTTTSFTVSLNAGNSSLVLEDDGSATKFTIILPLSTMYLDDVNGIFEVDLAPYSPIIANAITSTYSGPSGQGIAMGSGASLGSGMEILTTSLPLAINGLPTVDPSASNQVWNNMGVLMKDAA